MTELEQLQESQRRRAAIFWPERNKRAVVTIPDPPPPKPAKEPPKPEEFKLKNLDDLILKNIREPELRRALKDVCLAFEARASDIMSSNRVHPALQARQVLTWILSKLHGYSAERIAALFGQDRTSVHHSIRKAGRYIDKHNGFWIRAVPDMKKTWSKK